MPASNPGVVEEEDVAARVAVNREVLRPEAALGSHVVTGTEIDLWQMAEAWGSKMS